MTTQQIDLKEWCDIYGQYAVPFVAAGWRYATDLRSCIRVPAPGEPDSDNFPAGMPPLFDGWPELAPLPECPVVEMAMRDCPKCDGIGFSTTAPCKICGGDGECQCECCDDLHDCGKCNGKGWIGIAKCSTCGGKKRFEQPSLVDVLGITIDPRYLERVKALPGPITCAARKSIKSEAATVLFRFDGGEALVAAKARCSE